MPVKTNAEHRLCASWAADWSDTLQTDNTLKTTTTKNFWLQCKELD